ncbi:hypothetical protein ACKVWC_008039 [Pyricularia oryzae]
METDKLIMPANDGEKTKVQLTGTQGTLLATLYARYLDLKSEYSVFGDRWAAHVVDQIDWDWSQFNFSGMFPYLISMRGRQIDAYTLRFLEKHKETGATVVHMACGLDGRVHRMVDHYGGELPPRVVWIEADFPEVMELRKKLLPQARVSQDGGEYRQDCSSVLEPDWIASLPTDKPVLLIAEGLAFYLEPQVGKKMFRDLTESLRHAPGGGEIVLDCIGTNIVRWQSWIAAIQAVKAEFSWGIDRGYEVESSHPSLHLLEDIIYANLPGFEEMDWWNKFLLWTTRGPTPTFGRLLRLEFGDGLRPKL